MGDSRLVFFFDIDNCLYSNNTKVSSQMAIAIERYLQNHLSLTAPEAAKLHAQYLKTHGLAIRGLVHNHAINPLEFNTEVDDAIPLDDILSPDIALRKLLLDIDKSKVKLWLFTNAYVTHGRRVVRLLGIDDLFEGITYCDYAAEEMLCKPHRDMFAKAMNEAGVMSPEKCYFVDDSAANCAAAERLGWKVAHFLEDGMKVPASYICGNQIRDLQELRESFCHLFRQ